mgnify:CR=1 FL=1
MHNFASADENLPRMYQGPYFNTEGGGRKVKPTAAQLELEIHQALLAEVRAGSTRVSPETRANVLKREQELEKQVRSVLGSALARAAVSVEFCDGFLVAAVSTMQREEFKAAAAARRAQSRNKPRPKKLGKDRKPFTKPHSVPTEEEVAAGARTSDKIDSTTRGNKRPRAKKWTGEDRSFKPGEEVEANYAGVRGASFFLSGSRCGCQ